MRPLAESATIFLAPTDRYAVLGDLAETGSHGWSAFGSVLGLVLRQQMELWRVWQPWVAGSVAFAGGLLLRSASFGLSIGFALSSARRTQVWQRVVRRSAGGFVGVDERVCGGVALEEDARGERHSVRDRVLLLCGSVS